MMFFTKKYLMKSDHQQIIIHIAIKQLNFPAQIFKIIIPISPIFAQYRAPFWKNIPKGAVFAMLGLAHKKSDCFVFINNNFSSTIGLN